MSTTYAQKQVPAQKKEAPTAASVLDASSQSEGLQRKADMANNNVIQCYPMTPNFRKNHIGEFDDTSVVVKLNSRNTDPSQRTKITKNSVLNPEAVDALERYNEALDASGKKWQPIINVPCKTARLNNTIETDVVSVWITNEKIEDRLGHVDDNNAISIAPDSPLDFRKRTEKSSCDYNVIKNAVDSHRPLTEPQKTGKSLQEIAKETAEDMQKKLEEIFLNYIQNETISVFDGETCFFYNMDEIICLFKKIDEQEKYDFYLSFSDNYQNELFNARFETELSERWEIFFDKHLKKHYTTEADLDQMYKIKDEDKDEVSKLVWNFYKEIVNISCH